MSEKQLNYDGVILGYCKLEKVWYTNCMDSVVDRSPHLILNQLVITMREEMGYTIQEELGYFLTI